LLLRPALSLSSIGTLPTNFAQARRLVAELRGPGALVTTPPNACTGAVLRTMITGFGDLTTRVALCPRLTPAVITTHFASVRARLGPLLAVQEAVWRLSALLVGIVTTCRQLATLETKSYTQAAFEWFAWGFATSFCVMLILRLGAIIVWRRALR